MMEEARSARIGMTLIFIMVSSRVFRPNGGLGRYEKRRGRDETKEEAEIMTADSS